MVNILHGPGKINSIENIVKNQSPKRILLITGRRSYEKNKAKQVLEDKLSSYYFKVYKTEGGSPKSENVLKLINYINLFNPELLIAIGGGSVLDSVKSANLLSFKRDLSDKTIREYILKKAKFYKKIPSIFIPTTAGTGSEITPFAVIYIGGEKYSFASNLMIPEEIILDPELTITLDKHTTASCGCDALSQAIESYWSVNATDKSKKYSKKAIELIMKNFSKVITNPSLESRDDMLLGAHYSGRAISIAKTTAAHSISYPLTYNFGISHGHAVMLTLPYFFEINENINRSNIQIKKGFNIDYAKKTFSSLLYILKVKSGKEAKNKLLNLIDEIGLERKLSNLGIKNEDFSLIIEKGFNPERVINNPVRVTKKLVLEILEKIY